MTTSPSGRSWGRFGRATIRQIDVALAILVTALGLFFLVRAGLSQDSRVGFLFLQNVELRSLDLRFVVRGARPHDERITIVDIDERTLQNLGSFPIPRGAYARLVNRLHDAGARVITFDVTFPTAANNSALIALDALQKSYGSDAPPELRHRIQEIRASTDQDALFAAAMKRAGNVVLGHLFLDEERAKLSDPKLAEDYFNIAWGKEYPQIQKVKQPGRDFDLKQAWTGSVAFGAEANIAKLAEAAASYGYIDINTDPDGTLRHALLVLRYRDEDYFPPLAMQTLREYEKIPDQDIILFIAENGLERIQFGQRIFHPQRDGSQLINYTGPYGTYTHYSMVDVLDGKIGAAELRDKIILIGPTAKAIGDLRSTPFQDSDSAYMGVEVHANILDNLLHYGEPGRSFLTRGLRDEAIDAGFILLFGLGFGLWFGRTKPLYSTLSAFVTLALFASVVYVAFAWWGRWLSFVIPAGTLIANYAAITSFRMVFEEREKRKIRKTFGQYLSPGVIAMIEKDPEKYVGTSGEQKELTVMFTDIRGFTSISEGKTPAELVAWLNEYFSAMTDVLFEHYGTLDKYIGDAIMAFWGSPYPQKDHAYQACRCALGMMKKLEQLNAKWVAEGGRPAGMGIGLNTGPVNVGNMGSVKRLSWTVMGDNVNLASRLESLTKGYRLRAVVSESTYLQVADQFLFRELDQIRVKGKRQPVKIYELLGTPADREQFADLLERFTLAMKAYHAREWLQAAGELGDLLARYPEDGPTQIFLQRALEYMEEAPEPDWDGVYVMKTK
jgi:adenylate cyclase